MVEIGVSEPVPEDKASKSQEVKEVLTYEELDRRAEAALDNLEHLVGPEVLAELLAKPSDRERVLHARVLP